MNQFHLRKSASAEWKKCVYVRDRAIICDMNEMFDFDQDQNQHQHYPAGNSEQYL